jgi:multiple sugar transport system permease protein
MSTYAEKVSTTEEDASLEESRRGIRRLLNLTPRQFQIIWGYLFISPWIFGFLVFIVGPMVASLYLSLTDYNIGNPDATEFVGLENYENIFSLQVRTGDTVAFDTGYREFASLGDLHFGAKDYNFWQALQVTFIFAIVSLPLNLALALFLAILTNYKLPFVTFFRTAFYLPTVIPVVVSAFVFRQFLRQSDGWLNVYFIEPLGLDGPGWLTDPDYAIPALAIVGTWSIGTAMMIFLAGLQGVPTELYEAARVDGANLWHQFRHVTLPMISPVILYNLVIGLIGTFQYFVVAYNITTPVGSGGTDDSMLFYNLHLYKEAYVFFEMGYASALAWILFVIVMVITLIVFGTSGRWVYYSGGGKS